MSTSATMYPTSTPTISPDEFQALEQKVLRAVEIVKREREARVAAEAEIVALHQTIADQAARLEQQRSDYATDLEAHAADLDQHRAHSRAQLETLQQERIEIRQRVEKMLHQMDELL